MRILDRLRGSMADAAKIGSTIKRLRLGGVEVKELIADRDVTVVQLPLPRAALGEFAIAEFPGLVLVMDTTMPSRYEIEG